MSRFAAWLVAILVFAALTCSADAQTKRALVVGVDRYANLDQRQQLRKAVSDAETMGNLLGRLGFAVTVAKNPTLDEMLDKLAAVAEQTKAGDLVFVFFSGHGVAVDGSNLLLPSDAPRIADFGATARERLRRGSIAEADLVARLRERMVEKGTGQIKGLVVLVLDACRDNPFSQTQAGRTRSLGIARGLVEPRATAGVFSIYSAGADQQALDRLSESDASPNSVFTRVFAERLARPGTHLGDVVVEVREHVSALAQTITDPDTGLPHVQTPAYYDQTLGGKIFLAGAGNPGATPPADPCAAASAHWRSAETIGTVEAFESHLAHFGSCVFAGLARARVAALRTAPAQTARAPSQPVQGSLAPGPPAAGPSFSCAAADSPIEHAICFSPQLSTQDRAMADLYARAFAQVDSETRTELRDEQRAWLRQRNDCRGEADLDRCLAGAYGRRIAQLRPRAGGDIANLATPSVARSLPQATDPAAQRDPAGTRGPSFDCAAAGTAVERAICADAALSAKDRMLAQLYRDALRGLADPMRQGLLAAQRDWVRSRNGCRQPDIGRCLAQAYDFRIRELQRR